MNSKREPLWIHQVHCVPPASVNLLSVSAAIRDGAAFQCDPKGAYVKLCGPLGWECTIVNDRGLYCLQHVLPSANKGIVPTQSDRLFLLTPLSCSMIATKENYGLVGWVIQALQI